MTIADKVTSLRIILAPVFFVIYHFHRLFPSINTARFAGDGAAWTVPALWGIFVVSEMTDWLDGFLARRRGEVSDFGKLYDPFADTLTQMVYFLCFVLDGRLPVLPFLVVLYREFGILFLRNLMLRKGVALGARMGGKIKTVTYILAGGLALLASSAARLGADPGGALCRGLDRAASVVFVVSVVLAVLSFLDYLRVYRGKA